MSHKSECGVTVVTVVFHTNGEGKRIKKPPPGSGVTTNPKGGQESAML